MKTFCVYRKKCVCQRNQGEGVTVLWQWVYSHMLRGGVKEEKTHLLWVALCRGRTEAGAYPTAPCASWHPRVMSLSTVVPPICPPRVLCTWPQVPSLLPWASVAVVCQWFWTLWPASSSPLPARMYAQNYLHSGALWVNPVFIYTCTVNMNVSSARKAPLQQTGRPCWCYTTWKVFFRMKCGVGGYI